nr:MAG TPA: hypothetical protein [Bacteriophage sp.]
MCAKHYLCKYASQCATKKHCYEPMLNTLAHFT